LGASGFLRLIESMSKEYNLPPIFVVGSGRSGTTWIGDVLATCSGCVPVFEPLNQQWVPECPRWKMPGPYLRQGGSDPQWEAFFDGLLAGKISNYWTRQDNRRMPKFLTRRPLTMRIGARLAKTQYHWQEMHGRRYVVKEVFANLMLHWLANYTRGRIVYLIRHPCAVVGSRVRRPEVWDFEMNEIFCESSLMRDFLEPFRRTIIGANTLIERLAVSWCVENIVSLSQGGSHDWLVCCYEEFLADREEAFMRVLRRLGLLPTSVTRKTADFLVSHPTHDPRRSRPWHAPLSEAEGESVLRICEAFGLGWYGRQSTPLLAPGDLPGITGIRNEAPSGGPSPSVQLSPVCEIADSIGSPSP
jgi:Sulfotransferase family